MISLQDYLGGKFRGVEGWCVPHIWQCIEPIDRLQKAQGLALPIAEIGVHHGKFFIGLALMKCEARGHTAIDVFENQRFNPDKSGHGDSGALLRNMRECGLDVEGAVRLVARDSLSLTMADAVEYGKAFSMFSIDGCHDALHTYRDLDFAMQTTHQSGIIFVDDYYNEDWPGVHEGVARYYNNNMPAFVPLAYSVKKLILCHASHHENYLDALRAHLKEHFPSTKVKIVERYGWRNLTVKPALKDKRYLSAD
ncbi:MAG: hypothetical protein Tsb0010_14230 [Parvularculaceae bacterium]